MQGNPYPSNSTLAQPVEGGKKRQRNSHVKNILTEFRAVYRDFSFIATKFRDAAVSISCERMHQERHFHLDRPRGLK